MDGDPACIERTLTEMYQRFDRQYSTCDHNAAFGLTYIRVTESIRKAILDGVYEEPRYLGHEDRVFARMYFESYDAWKAGKRDQVPAAWREAWDAGRAKSVTGLGNLLLSMNAHINRDMPYLVEAIGLYKPDGSSRKPDHDRGNPILNTLYDDVIEELAARFDSTVDDLDVPGLVADDAALFQMLQGWREGVWRNAEMLDRAENAGQRKAASDYIEQYALGQARMIRSFTTVSSSAPRDAHCAGYRRIHREQGGVARADRPKGQPGEPQAAREGARALPRGHSRLPRPAGADARQAHAGPHHAAVHRGRRLTRGHAQARPPDLPDDQAPQAPAVVAVTGSPSPWGTTRTATARASPEALADVLTRSRAGRCPSARRRRPARPRAPSGRASPRPRGRARRP